MSWIISLVLFYVLSVVAYHLYVRYSLRKRDPKRTYLPVIVTPWYFPFLGPVLSMLDVGSALKRWQAKYGENFTIRLIGKDFTFITHHPDLKKYFHANEDMLSLVRAAKVLVGSQYPEPEYIEETVGISYMQIILNPSYLRHMVHAVERSLIEYFNPKNGRFWMEHGDQAVVDIMDFCYKLVIRMNCESFTSKSVYENHVDELIKLFSILDTEKRALNPVTEELKNLLGRNSFNHAAWQRWLDILTPDVERCLQMIEDKVEPPEFDVMYQAVKLAKSELEKRGQPFTRRMIGYLVYTTFLPAQLNTYATASLLILRWIQHQNEEIGQRMREEIERVAPSIGEITYDELGSLQYIEACIYEVIRFSTDAQSHVRCAVQDVPLSDGRYIPAGNIVLVSTAGSRQLFPNPDKFDPDRHLPPREEQKIDPYRIVPFGRGKHPCTGERYVKMQIKLMLIHLSQMCDMEIMKESLDYEKTINRKQAAGLSRPSKPVYVRLSKRIQ